MVDRAWNWSHHASLKLYGGLLLKDYSWRPVYRSTGTDHGIFMLPKLFTSLSYRERQDSYVWRIEATRNPNAQGWDIEIMAVVDIIANGMVKVKLTEDGLQTVQVPFPLVTCVKLTIE